MGSKTVVGKVIKPLSDPLKKLDPGKPARAAARQAAKVQETQTAAIEEQTRQEKVAAAEAASDVAKRRALAKPSVGGRSLLTATSPRGITKKLGGTA